MLIDWFTVGAQALNFLILVWLMKRFLYAPILHAIDAREKRVASALADAITKKEEALEERTSFENKNIEFAQQRAARLKEVDEEVEEERRRLLSEAHATAVALSNEHKEALRSEELKLQQSVMHRTQREVFDIARKTLADLAGLDLEERMVEVFLRRLRALDESRRAALADSLKTPNGSIRVRTAFDLSAAQHAAIQTALDEALCIDTPIDFETDVDLISGVELTANGHKVAWSTSNYLTALEEHAAETLEEATESRGRPGTQST